MVTKNILSYMNLCINTHTHTQMGRERETVTADRPYNSNEAKEKRNDTEKIKEIGKRKNKTLTHELH